MPDYRKALLFCKLERKKEYTVYDSSINSRFEEEFSTDALDRYVKDIQQYDMLERDEERKLLFAAQNKDLFARERLIHSNLRLVVRIARRYRRPGVALPDLIAEGNFGLIHAIRKFDLSLEHRFSTYASWWIQHYVEYYLLNQIRVVRLPVHISKKIYKVEKIEKKLVQAIQPRRSATKQVAEYVGLSIEDLSRLKIWADPGVSLDYQEEDISTPHFEEQRDQDFLSLEEIVHKNDREMHYSHTIQNLLSSLSDLEKDIVFHRTGIGGFEEMTFEEIGAHMDIKKDRVRCIYQKALKKMLQGRKNSEISQSLIPSKCSRSSI